MFKPNTGMFDTILYSKLLPETLLIDTIQYSKQADLKLDLMHFKKQAKFSTTLCNFVISLVKNKVKCC